MLEVQAVGVELGDAAGGDDDAGGVAAELEDVQGLEEGAAERGREAVVRGGDEGEQVDLGLRLGGGDGAAWVGAAGGDRHGEEGHCWRRDDAGEDWAEMGGTGRVGCELRYRMGFWR